MLAAISTPLHTFQIVTDGNPDLVAVYRYYTDPSFQRWIIEGPPEAFLKMRLPDLTELIPSLREVEVDANYSYIVEAIQYDQLDYDQILAGFPYKGNDRFFPVARSGFQIVAKGY